MSAATVDPARLTRGTRILLRLWTGEEAEAVVTHPPREPFPGERPVFWARVTRGPRWAEVGSRSNHYLRDVVEVVEQGGPEDEDR